MGGKRALVFVCVVLCLLSVAGVLLRKTHAQVELVDHQEFLSGGATLPDMQATAAGPTSPTGAGRPPRVGPNTRVNAAQAAFPNGLLGRSETTVTSNTDGTLAVVGFNDAQGFCGAPFGVACTPQTPPGLSGFAFTTDGGVTWADGGAPDPALFGNVFTRGDPWMDMGGFDDATVYYANLAVDATTAAALGVSVHRGHFSGSTFNWEDVRVVGPANPNDFFDKNAMAAAKNGSGLAVVSLTNFIELCGQPAFGFGQIELFRTVDAGDTWVGPTVVSPDATFITNPADPNCGLTGVLQQSSVPAIGPKGEVYEAWQFGPTFNPGLSTDAEIRVARSLDGGVTFDKTVTVAKINSMRANPPVGYNRNRINDHPRIAVAASGPNQGRVFVVFYSAVAAVSPAPRVACPAGLPANAICVGQTLTSSQLFLTYSDDQGATFTTPTPIAPVVPDTGVKRWWPVVTLEPGGNVDVVYYESQEKSIGTTCTIGLGGRLRRTGSAVSLVDLFWVQSVNSGASFSAPTKVSTATTNWCTTASNIRPNFGDYIGSASGGNRLLPVWADGRNGVADVFYAQILASGKVH